ncbi:hypothetical protein Hanom_Chr14g01256161 [Helianthus anomalus]
MRLLRKQGKLHRLLVFLGCHIIPPLIWNFDPKFRSSSFSLSSGCKVNSGPRREFQRTRTRDILVCLRTLTSRSVILTGSSTNCNHSSIVSSFKGTMRVSSDRHFFRFDTWKTL